MKALSTAVLAAVTLVGPMQAPAASPPQSAPASQQTAGFKIAYVDIGAVFDAAPGKVAAESTYNNKGKELETQLGKLADSLQKEITRFQAEEAKLLPLDKAKREKALQDLQLEAQKKNEGARAQLDKLRNDLMAPINDLVKTVLDEIRDKDGYALILANDPMAPLVVAGDKNLDITDKAILKIKAKPIPNAPIKRPGGK